MTTTTIRITGMDAISWAEMFGANICKYADPTEGAREGLTMGEAWEVAREDPSLIYVDADGDTVVVWRIADEAAKCEADARHQGWDGETWEATVEDEERIVRGIEHMIGREPTRDELLEGYRLHARRRA